MTAVCKTWSIPSRKFKPLCNNLYEAVNNTNECPVCVKPVYGAEAGIQLGQCGCPPTSGEIQRSWTLSVTQGSKWNDLTQTQKDIFSCYLGSHMLTNSILAWYAVNGINKDHSYGETYSPTSCVQISPAALSPPQPKFECEMYSFKLAAKGSFLSSTNYCSTYPYYYGATDGCLPAYSMFYINLAGTTYLLSQKRYRFNQTNTAQVIFRFGGKAGGTSGTQLPSSLCSFGVPDKLPACDNSEPFSYQLYAVGALSGLYNGAFNVILSGS
jgi:hypothetical protein